MPESETLSHGSLVGERYRILETIGGGAMAQVYKAEDEREGGVCAVKVLCERAPEERGSPTLFMDTAIREAGFLKTLAHPCLPRFLDFFRAEDRLYLVMEFVEGQNLKHFLYDNEQSSLDIALIVEWGIQICDVLTYLHEQNPPVVFRDLKPSNLIRRPNNEICLVDFGIARYDRSNNASDTVVLGSPGYAPPEQYGQGHTTPKSDIYALGATLHHLLTGRDPSLSPFKWPALRTLNPIVPIALENLVMKCLQLDAARRPDSAAAVAKGLRELKRMLDEVGGDAGALSGTGDLRRSTVPPPRRPDSATDILPTLDERGLPALSARRSGQRIPAAPQFARPEYRSAPLPFWQDGDRLRGLVQIGAIFAVLFSLGLPVASGLLEPRVPPRESSAPLPEQADTAERAAYRQEQAQRNTEITRMQQTRENYRGLLPIRVGLALLVSAAFASVLLRPQSPSRFALVLYLGGTLGLFCLSVAALLPEWSSLFLLLVLLEALIALPAALLLARPETI